MMMSIYIILSVIWYQFRRKKLLFQRTLIITNAIVDLLQSSMDAMFVPVIVFSAINALQNRRVWTIRNVRRKESGSSAPNTPNKSYKSWKQELRDSLEELVSHRLGLTIMITTRIIIIITRTVIITTTERVIPIGGGIAGTTIIIIITLTITISISITITMRFVKSHRAKFQENTQR